MPASSKPPRPLELQARDIDLLRGLFESRVMSAAQISTIYFAGRSEMARKRLQRLTAARLVSRHPKAEIRSVPFILAQGGLVELRRLGILHEYPQLDFSNLARRAIPSPRLLPHDLEVMDVKAAFVRRANSAGAQVLEFTTWPLLNRFETRRGQSADPDGFARIRSISSANDTSFFIEVDRSTELLGYLVQGASDYLWYYRSGRYAAERLGVPEGHHRHPFRVLFILKTAERRNNIAEQLLQLTPPILQQVWLTTHDEVISGPFDPIWITPSDYRDALSASQLSTRLPHEYRNYRRNGDRDRLIEKHLLKRRLLDGTQQRAA